MSADVGDVVGWKFGHRPGMATVDGVITEWPAGEPLPTEAELAAWTVEYELIKARAEKTAAVEARLAAAFAGGLAYAGKVLQIGEADQQNIIAMSQRAGLASGGAVSWPAAFAWRMADNSFLAMPTPADMIALATAAADEVYRLRQVAWAHKDAIEGLAIAAEVMAYDIEQGW